MLREEPDEHERTKMKEEGIQPFAVEGAAFVRMSTQDAQNWGLATADVRGEVGPIPNVTLLDTMNCQRVYY